MSASFCFGIPTNNIPTSTCPNFHPTQTPNKGILRCFGETRQKEYNKLELGLKYFRSIALSSKRVGKRPLELRCWQVVVAYIHEWRACRRALTHRRVGHTTCSA